MPAHLIRAARHWDVDLYWKRGLILDDLRDEIDRGQPVIVLVHYPSIPERFDPRYQSGHWLLIIGYSDATVTYLDPYWLERGQKTIAWQQFYAAWDNNHIDGNSDRQALRMRE